MAQRSLGNLGAFSSGLQVKLELGQRELRSLKVIHQDQESGGLRGLRSAFKVKASCAGPA